MKISLMIALLFVSAAAVANTVHCGGRDSKYSVRLSEDRRTAQILYDRQRLQFGELECRDSLDSGEYRSDLFCHSRDVADAGYSAHFFQFDRQTYVRLSEVYFMGGRTLDTLPCYFVP
jgi:hypothetical protein